MFMVAGWMVGVGKGGRNDGSGGGNRKEPRRTRSKMERKISRWVGLGVAAPERGKGERGATSGNAFPTPLGPGDTSFF